ncbi:MAG: cobalamin B12-binding domain-containing protein [Pseudomonadota bacterium]
MPDVKDVMPGQKAPGLRPGRAGARASGSTGSALLGDSSLARTIEQEIIPRLMLAHRTSVEQAAIKQPDQVQDEMSRQRFAGSGLAAIGWPSREEAAPQQGAVLSMGALSTAHHVSELARLVVEHDDTVLHSYVQTIQLEGVTMDNLFREVLPETARRLGDQWCDDTLSFADVTLGLSRLQRFVRDHQMARIRSTRLGEPVGRVLLAPFPGEQHTFGLQLVGKVFGEAGWDVRAGPFASQGEIEALLANSWFAVAGFSTSCTMPGEKTRDMIARFRAFSRNPNMLVLIGGHIFAGEGMDVDLHGADATAPDGEAAVRLANRHLVNDRAWTMAAAAD